jgi:hypothetical protein
MISTQPVAGTTNTVQHPLPSATRCLKLGQSVGRAIEAQLHSNYHIPISNTAAAVMLLENAA